MRPRLLAPAASLVLAVALIARAGLAEQPKVRITGASRVSATGYIEYRPGSLPIILSAPHGGTWEPKELPDRNYGKVMRDTNTIELAEAMRAAMQKRFGAAPALIVCKIARHKLDCNREIVEAAQGNKLAEKAWREYHDFIEEAKAELLGHHARGLYLDIHGHAHEKQRVELGYGLGKEQLQLPESKLDALVAKTSIRGLQNASASKATLTELLRGKTGLGGLLEARGILCAPSPTMEFAKEDLFFNGGYDVHLHGSMDGGKVDAIQLEHPKNLRDTAAHRAKMAEALAEALSRYFELHYQATLGVK